MVRRLILPCAVFVALFLPEGLAGVRGYVPPDDDHAIEQEPRKEPRLTIGLEGRLTTGKSAWEISFMDFFPGLGVVEGRSKLEWDDLDSAVTVLFAEYRINSWFSLGASAGMGSIRDGRGRDTDFLTDPATRDEIVFLESVADTRGDLYLFDLNAYFNLNDLLGWKDPRGRWDVFVGYQYYKEELNDRGGVETRFMDAPIFEPFPGLNSTFDFEWRAARTGLRGVYPVTPRVDVKGTVALLWAVDYRGEGFWNLRTDFRDEAPNFVQRGDGGRGGELKASMVFRLPNHFSAEVGYWWISMQVRDGEDRVFFADGTEAETRLDWARSYRHGVFAGLAGRF